MADPVRFNVLDETRSRLDVLEKRFAGQPLHEGGGGGTISHMEERVSKLETHFEYVRRDLDALKAGQDAIIGKLDGLVSETVATRHAAAGKVTVISTGIAVVAILLGVLAYGGDRFSQGMEVTAATGQAIQAATAPAAVPAR